MELEVERLLLRINSRKSCTKLFEAFPHSIAEQLQTAFVLRAMQSPPFHLFIGVSAFRPRVVPLFTSVAPTSNPAIQDSTPLKFNTICNQKLSNTCAKWESRRRTNSMPRNQELQPEETRITGWIFWGRPATTFHFFLLPSLLFLHGTVHLKLKGG